MTDFTAIAASLEERGSYGPAKVKRKRGFLARLLNPFAKVLSPIGLQNPSNRIASRPAGGAFITPAIYYSYDFLLRWRAAAVVLHLATALALAGSPSARHSPT